MSGLGIRTTLYGSFGGGKTRMISDVKGGPPESPRWKTSYAGVRKKRGRWYVGVKCTMYWNSFAPSFAYTVLERSVRTWVPIEATDQREAIRVGQAYVGVHI